MFRLANLAERITHRHFGSFLGNYLQQDSRCWGLQFIADFFGLQFDQQITRFDSIALLFQPAHHDRFRAGDSSRLRHNNGGYDASSPIKRPFGKYCKPRALSSPMWTLCQSGYLQRCKTSAILV